MFVETNPLKSIHSKISLEPWPALQFLANSIAKSYRASLFPEPHCDGGSTSGASTTRWWAFSSAMVSFSSQNPGLFAHREGIQNWRNLDALVFVSLICFETHGKDWEGIDR